jgi:pSer/pThr/pTyr-binding forkhead associated (FHA) protein
MSWSVLPLSGAHRGETFPLRTLPFTIGREAGCQLRAKSPEVAPRHCTLYLDGEQLAVEPHGGDATYLDGLPVLSPIYVGDSSVLQVGPLFFKLLRENEDEKNNPSLGENAASIFTE